jgi:acetyl-CoA C-acetyltransferase
MTGALHDPFGNGHMGVTAENIAAKYGFTREQQDAFALESHRRARTRSRRATSSRRSSRRAEDAQGRRAVHQRRARAQDVEAEDMAKLKAVFKKDGTVTAGNASGINDAGAAIVMMEPARRRRRARSRWRGSSRTRTPASSRT